MDSDWDRFVSRCHQALDELVEGRPEPFKALWSHADGVVIVGAFGSCERGWRQVSARLDWAAKGIKSTSRSAENVLTVVNDDLAYTVDLEHTTRHAGGQLVPRTLRCTQVYLMRATARASSSRTRAEDRKRRGRATPYKVFSCVARRFKSPR